MRRGRNWKAVPSEPDPSPEGEDAVDSAGFACPLCGRPLEACACVCPFCGESADCRCCIGYGVATGG